MKGDDGGEEIEDEDLTVRGQSLQDVLNSLDDEGKSFSVLMAHN